uniref:LRR receptor-like serine/threonine-protein kinase n=1 Tax=Aegilops tauschii TaxID=37682 RepID=M8CAN1_AEGTA
MGSVVASSARLRRAAAHPSVSLAGGKMGVVEASADRLRRTKGQANVLAGLLPGRWCHGGTAARFGIMLLEVFTGKRPMNPMFIGESSLRQWVSQAFPARLVVIVDEKLLQGEEISSHGFHQQTNIPPSASPSTASNTNFLVSAFELGLECSSDSPDHRPSMDEVVVKLKNIKKDCSASMAARLGVPQR